MQNFILGLLSVGVTALFGWVFSTNSKVNVQDRAMSDLEKLINFRFDAQDQRLERIERAMNGALKH